MEKRHREDVQTDQEIQDQILRSAQDIEVPGELSPARMAERLRSVGGSRRRGYRRAAVAACLCLCLGAGGVALRYSDQAAKEQFSLQQDELSATESLQSDDIAEGSEASDTADAMDDKLADDAETIAEPPVKKLGRMYTLAKDYEEVYDHLASQEAVYSNYVDDLYFNGKKDMARGEAAAEDTANSSFNMAVAAESEKSMKEESAAYSTTNLQVEGVDESDIVKTDGKYIYVVQESKVRVIDVQTGKAEIAGEIAPQMDLGTDQICEMYVADGKLILILQTEKTSMEEDNGQDEGNNQEETDTTYIEGSGNAAPSVNGIVSNIVPLEGEDSADGSDSAGGTDTANSTDSADGTDTANSTDSADGTDTANSADTADNIGASGVSYGSQEDMAVTDRVTPSYIRVDVETKVLAYDISDPREAKLQYQTIQDGWYRDSRKIGDRLYLFTGETLWPGYGQTRQEALEDGRQSGWLPCVNDQVANDIYLGARGNESWLMASIDLANNGKLMDSKMLIGENAQLYVTEKAAYLYYVDYINSVSYANINGRSNPYSYVQKTRIAKFVLTDDGRIQPKAAGAVRGTITDTFAINEKDGCLRVLTTADAGSQIKNRVYVLDGNMKVIGKLTDLAVGERIYAARFLGNTGYFVTYRNTDPLFSVDFRNPTQPKILGELKVTGFSEYLHFWSGDLLLGIGNETDPDSGEWRGIKLSMFDVSDPANVTEKARKVIKDANYSPALYDYKSILVDPVKNVIAFIVGTAQDPVYEVFSYQDGEFVNCLKETYPGESWENQRSLYVGDILYLVDQNRLWAFDMNTWKKKTELEL